MESRTSFASHALLADAARRAAEFLEGLPDRRVGASSKAVDGLWTLTDGPLPARGKPAADVLRELDEIAREATVSSAGPRYFGLVTGGALPAALAANWLAGAWDQNAAVFASSPAAALIERQAIAWMLEVLDLPMGCAASLTTGASLANLTCLVAARSSVLQRVGVDVDRDGLFGAPPITVAVGREAHPTLRKALGVLGLGRERVIELEVDGQGRIRPDRLPRLSGPLIVCAQAGNVNSGASDPFDALRDWADGHGGWLHVDGAFGLWARASTTRRDQVASVERADSWATDAHKWLNVPYDCGVAFVRDPNVLRGAMAFEAPYIPTGADAKNGRREPVHNGLEASRRARGMEVWAALRQLGREGVGDLIDRCCGLAERFAEALSAEGFVVLNEVALNQVVVSFGEDAPTARIIARLQEEGVCWCGPTRWQARDGMRISVSNWATSEVDVDRSVESIIRCARAEMVGSGDTG